MIRNQRFYKVFIRSGERANMFVVAKKNAPLDELEFTKDFEKATLLTNSKAYSIRHYLIKEHPAIKVKVINGDDERYMHVKKRIHEVTPYYKYANYDISQIASYLNLIRNDIKYSNSEELLDMECDLTYLVDDITRLKETLHYEIEFRKGE